MDVEKIVRVPVMVDVALMKVSPQILVTGKSRRCAVTFWRLSQVCYCALRCVCPESAPNARPLRDVHITSHLWSHQPK